MKQPSLSYEGDGMTSRFNVGPPRRINKISVHSSLKNDLLERKRSFGLDEAHISNKIDGCQRRSSANRSSLSPDSKKLPTVATIARPVPMKIKSKSTGNDVRTEVVTPPAGFTRSMFTEGSKYPETTSIPTVNEKGPNSSDGYNIHFPNISGKSKSLDDHGVSITFTSSKHNAGIADHELFWLGEKSSSTQISASAITTLRGGGIFRSNGNLEERSLHQQPHSLELQNDPLIQSNQELPTMHYSSLGDIYSNSNAMTAYKMKKLGSQSVENSKRCRLVFVNQTSQTLVLCWVGFNHKLHHYRTLKPSSSTTILGGLGVSDTHFDTRLDGGVHSEQSFLGHAFVLGIPPSKGHDNSDGNDSEYRGHHYYDDSDTNDNTKQCWMHFKQKNIFQEVEDQDTKLDKSKIQTIIGAYRPIHLTLNSKDDDEINEECFVHLITITEELAFLPKKILSIPQKVFHLSVRQCQIDNTPLDTSKKEYNYLFMGGWKVMYENGLFISKIGNAGEGELIERFRERFEADLIAAKKKLPRHAYKSLKKTTPFWVNEKQYYGPKAAPIKGKGMCFHPGGDWLKENGMSEEKSGGIELYEACDYLEDCDLWYGQGGVLIHELSHAFHNKCLVDGYSNKEVISCYEAAMKERLYDKVCVHTLDGKTEERRAYACTDAMEYFAELSVAFLGGTGDDEDLEFNKWFPFNRKQLKAHDPRAYRMLKKMWLLQTDDEVIDDKQ